MTRRSPVRQVDVKRAVRGAIAAGLTVTGVRIDDAGVTVLTGAGRTCGGAGPGIALGSEAIKAALRKARSDTEDRAALREAEAYLDATYGDDAGPGVRHRNAKR